MGVVIVMVVVQWVAVVVSTSFPCVVLDKPVLLVVLVMVMVVVVVRR